MSSSAQQQLNLYQNGKEKMPFQCYQKHSHESLSTWGRGLSVCSHMASFQPLCIRHRNGEIDYGTNNFTNCSSRLEKESYYTLITGGPCIHSCAKGQRVLARASRLWGTRFAGCSRLHGPRELGNRLGRRGTVWLSLDLGYSHF